jgi:hypothetical protein
LTNLRSLIENHGLENKALHQKTLNLVEISTSKVLGSVGSQGDATRASIAKSEAVILDRMQQLSLPQHEYELTFLLLLYNQFPILSLFEILKKDTEL